MRKSSRYSSRSRWKKKRLNTIQELDEDSRIENFVSTPNESSPITSNENVENQKQNSTKSVRFSDQFAIKSEVHSTIDNEDFDATENEIFYDALESLSELSMPLDKQEIDRNFVVVVGKNGNLDSTELDSSMKKLEAGSSIYMANSPESFNVERYKKPNSTINVTRNQRKHMELASGRSGGIFAIVVHAVKEALRKFSGSRLFKNMSREPVEQTPLSVTPEADAASSKILTSPESVVPRNAERSRDAKQVPLSSPETGDLINDTRSPMTYRHRGWYRIRGREPIARMRAHSMIPLPSVEMHRRYEERALLMKGNREN